LLELFNDLQLLSLTNEIYSLIIDYYRTFPWDFLKPGDIIDVVAPSSGKSLNDPQVRQAIQFIEKLGYHLRYTNDLINNKQLFSFEY